MKIAIDARSLTARPTGVGQYLMAAVNVWSELEPSWSFELLAHKPLHAAAEAALVRRNNVNFHTCPAPWLAGNGLWWMLSHFERAAQERGAALLWGASGVLPPLSRIPSLLTVHDLVYRTLPETMALRTRIAYGLLAGQAIRRADHIWAVSNYTASEIARYYPRRSARTTVIGAGLNPLRAQHSHDEAQLAELRSHFELTDRSLLFVGTLEPRKNLRFLLSLMPTLAAKGYRLIVVGCSGWGRSSMATLVNAPGFPTEAIRFCDYVSDSDLQGLYRSAALFVSTSLLEGFGLPQLEAMAAGCPVVAAANSAVIEVVGDGGRLVEGWRPEDWIASIEWATEHRPELQQLALNRLAAHDLSYPCRALSKALSRD